MKRIPKPPKSLQDVKDYIKEKALNVDGDFFYSYFEAGNWFDKNGNPVLSWKQKLWTWHGREKHKNKLQAQKKDIEVSRQRIRDDCESYLMSKSTSALIDIKKDGGHLSQLAGWLIDEIITKRNE